MKRRTEGHTFHSDIHQRLFLGHRKLGFLVGLQSCFYMQKILSELPCAQWRKWAEGFVNRGRILSQGVWRERRLTDLRLKHKEKTNSLKHSRILQEDFVKYKHFLKMFNYPSCQYIFLSSCFMTSIANIFIFGICKLHIPCTLIVVSCYIKYVISGSVPCLGY